MDARSLSDAMLNRIVENGRRLLEEGQPDDPDAVRRVLEQVEAEKERREGLVQRMSWSEGDVAFKRPEQ